jgi:hypothetical protein
MRLRGGNAVSQIPGSNQLPELVRFSALPGVRTAEPKPRPKVRTVGRIVEPAARCP